MTTRIMRAVGSPHATTVAAAMVVVAFILGYLLHPDWTIVLPW